MSSSIYLIQANDNGDYFPLWGTCLGFQLLCVLQAETDTILTSFDAANYSIPLNFTQGKQQILIVIIVLYSCQ